MDKFNPTVKEFLAEHEDLTIMGLVWAGWWRIYLVIIGVSLAFTLLGAIFG